MAPDELPLRPSTLEAGQVIDGFRLEERTHQGGMAHLWRVSFATPPAAGATLMHPLPMIMKVPRIKGGEDPATIVGFEVEQMIMPALSGPHVPKHPGRVAQGTLRSGAAARQRGGRDRLEGRDRLARTAPPARGAPRCEAEQHHVPQHR
jgi:hypothetical protein